jgi:hypothetical protein
MHTPSRWIFIVSLLLAIVALIGAAHLVAAVEPYAVYAALVAWLVLTIGCFIKTT